MGDSRKKWEEMQEERGATQSSNKKDIMIKLTALHYKIKPEALEMFHNITQHNDALMFEWEAEFEKQKSIDGDYPEKPFIEPFEFQDSDYVRTDRKLRLRSKDVYLYKENMDDMTELTTSDGLVYTVKETVDEIDAMLQE